jgi:3-dehydroquinate synthetase/predicted NBD/HSP70 family sugar kinase
MNDETPPGDIRPMSLNPERFACCFPADGDVVPQLLLGHSKSPHYFLPPGPPIIVFDLGGTTFRSGLATPTGGLVDIEKRQSITVTPTRSGEEAASEIFKYICGRTALLSSAETGVAVSLGAALNAHSGEVFGSGPILGTSKAIRDFKASLHRELPRRRLILVNDVTAAVVGHSLLPEFARLRRVALITVSSGVASRTLSLSAPSIPVDAHYGVQGEIGHQPIQFSIDGIPFTLSCACGGENHLSAFASGQGIERVVDWCQTTLGPRFPDSPLAATRRREELGLSRLIQGVAANDRLSYLVLQAITRPIADAVRWHILLDPEIDKIVLTGGVSSRLGPAYLEAILAHLNSRDFDPLKTQNTDFWRNRLVLGPTFDDAGLVGAAYIARQQTELYRRENLEKPPSLRISRDYSLDYGIRSATGISKGKAPPEPKLNFERLVIVCDRLVAAVYKQALSQAFSYWCSDLEFIELDISESQKDLFTVTELWTTFDRIGLRRRGDLVVTIGGGALTDSVGFAASVYRRGIPVVRVPTTLVGIIDAAVGVKTGLNFRRSKNRIGTFSAPVDVLIDTGFMETLDRRQVANGLAEALKISLVTDRRLFELLERYASELIACNLVSPVGDEVVWKSISAMLRELAPNLQERVPNRLPDYGHTFSPQFELETADLQHGEAVAVDMALSTGLAVTLGLLPIDKGRQILAVQQNLGLPVFHEVCREHLLVKAVIEARRHRGGTLALPLLRDIGLAVFVDNFPLEALAQSIAFVTSGVMS